MTEHVDVLIIGAGVAGVGAAHHIRQEFPGRSLAILEGRERVGGTWDLFRYPGIRSDSDAQTFAYGFRPWDSTHLLAPGDAIRQYVEDTAKDGGFFDSIRFGHKVIAADWSSVDNLWTITAEHGGEQVTITATIVHWCVGYYRYEAGYRAEIPGIENFDGPVVHPQFWPEDLDYTGKKVVIIGSGATAVTLVPSMADTAAHVTMLQRSPTYVLPVPKADPTTVALRKVLGHKLSYPLIRAKNVGTMAGMYWAFRAFPKAARALVRQANKLSLPKGYAVDTHFKPKYAPWDQRVCIVPDGDLFAAIRDGKASVVTDHITGFTGKSVQLKSGQELEADVVITATGLEVQFLGGVPITVDGTPFDPAQAWMYRTMLLSGLPNTVVTIGYPNFSWTLKVNIVAAYLTRLLEHMDAHGYNRFEAVQDDPSMQEQPVLDLASGYIQRAAKLMPKAGSKGPWRPSTNFPKDAFLVPRAKIDDGVLRLSKAPVREAAHT
ncbi:NAD(P)/FAD-dependent oxidoreductase [Pseudonocardiaceae bacterium YIM PH 21723]|nr:NAD(P)/FAD-dependent oxidoreductase [Pseudonocardiaceae bacterium YIM PH 21723]